METLHLFARDLFVGFAATSPVALIIWLGRIISLGGNASSAGRKNFPELSAFSEDDQERILHAADRRAFSGWRLVVVPLAYAALLSGSIAASRALREVRILPDSIWVVAGSAVIIVAFGSWVGRRLEVERIRPVLLSELDKLKRNKMEKANPENSHPTGNM